MKLITSIEILNEITSNYFLKKTITNNYLLPAAYLQLIDDKKIFFIVGNTNCLLFVEKNGFYRLFYYINNLSEILEVISNKPIVMEILFRGESHKQQGIFNYWEKCGFKKHLTRDNLVASFKQMTLPKEQLSGLKWKYANTELETIFTQKLLENSLDEYTGDRLSSEEVKSYVKNNNIICAYWENELAGALQFEIKNNIVWLGHIAVSPKFRGKGIAKELVKVYIEVNKTTPSTRYQLWVINDNLSAVRLYNRFGFIYGNKSSASMLKL
jgi:GNAT superfamily N-acetyltransferase